MRFATFQVSMEWVVLLRISKSFPVRLQYNDTNFNAYAIKRNQFTLADMGSFTRGYFYKMATAETSYLKVTALYILVRQKPHNAGFYPLIFSCTSA